MDKRNSVFVAFLLCLMLLASLLSGTAHAVLAIDDFDPNVSNNSVFSIAVQSDGKILIGGSFTGVSGVARNYIARLNTDGTLDPDFTDPAIDTKSGGSVTSIVIQTDGKILVGGNFASIGGVPRNNIARLNADGTLDTTFDPNANGIVNTIALQTDGSILLGGEFTTVSTVARNRIARVDSSGALDTVFNPDAGGIVRSIVLQPDGKILMGGDFTTVSTVGRNRIARLDANGTLDTVFNPNANDGVWSIFLQADGRILIGGNFTTVSTVARNRIARLESNGTLDTGFDPNAQNSVFSIALQADNKILVGGAFTAIGGGTKSFIARLETTGALDTAFNLDPNGNVTSIAVQQDGKILLGGYFTAINTPIRRHLARLIANYTLTANAGGSGWGAVTSSIGEIGYTYPAATSGSAEIAPCSDVTLTATAVNSSTTWSGYCNSTGGTATAATCVITCMNAARTATASFIADPAYVKVDGDITAYYAVDAALDSITAPPDRTVYARNLVFTENVTMDSPVTIVLKGGYTDDAFTNPASSMSVIDGTLRVNSGVLKVSRFVVR